MKGILGLLRQRSQAERSGEEQLDSVMFTTAFADQGVDPSLLLPWEARATEVGAKKLNAERATKILQSLWAKDKYMSHLDDHAIHSLQMFFEFALVPAGRDIIRQDEYGNFMVVLLNGNIAVDRLQPWVNACVWQKPGPVTFWVRCRCWTAVSASRHAPPSLIVRLPF